MTDNAMAKQLLISKGQQEVDNCRWADNAMLKRLKISNYQKP